MYKDGEKEKQPIKINNLKDALAFAEKDLLNNWQRYRMNFLKSSK